MWINPPLKIVPNKYTIPSCLSFFQTTVTNKGQLSYVCSHVWQRASPPPPACPSHSSCPLGAAAGQRRSAAGAGCHAASRPHPLNHPHLLVRPRHHRPGPPASDCPEGHHLQTIQCKVKHCSRFKFLVLYNRMPNFSVLNKWNNNDKVPMSIHLLCQNASFQKSVLIS